MKQLATLRVNGRDRQVAIEPDDVLLDVLRNELSLFGAREGCGIGMCGACTVLLDGRPVSSCLLLAGVAEGCSIETVEGLAADGELHPIQQAFLKHNAFQCSYCTPGFILSVKALLEEEPSPTPEYIRGYLAGNLCRCGSYQKILDAVLELGKKDQ
jgi:carbon-monoxide dehydrogenase small subunit